MPKRNRDEGTYALGNRKIGDFDPAPTYDRPPVHDSQTLVDQLLNPRAPLETGTWTEGGGYQRDVTEAERAELIAKVQHARTNAPRTANVPRGIADVKNPR